MVFFVPMYIFSISATETAFFLILRLVLGHLSPTLYIFELQCREQSLLSDSICYVTYCPNL